MKEALIKRFKEWCYCCLNVLKQYENGNESKVVSYQLTKSATSSYLNYRAACRAKSTADMINKFKIVEEELDESIAWLEIIKDRSILNADKEIKEGNELLSIIVASINTLRRKTT